MPARDPRHAADISGDRGAGARGHPGRAGQGGRTRRAGSHRPGAAAGHRRGGGRADAPRSCGCPARSAAWVTRSGLPRPWSRRPEQRLPRRRKSWTNPSARRCAVRSARARRARASRPRCAVVLARCGTWRTGRSRGRPGSSAMRWTGPCWIWPGSTATCWRSSWARRSSSRTRPADDELQLQAAAAGPADTVRKVEAIMRCRQRLEANVAPLLAVEELTLALARAADRGRARRTDGRRAARSRPYGRVGRSGGRRAPLSGRNVGPWA